MKSKTAAVFFATWLASTCWGADAPRAEKSSHTVYTLLMQEQWLPKIIMNQRGIPQPEPLKDYETAPSGLVCKVGTEWKSLNAGLMRVSVPVVLSENRFSPGVLRESTTESAAAKPKSGKKETFEPLVSLAVESKSSLVCLFPEVKTDWRKIGSFVVNLDSYSTSVNHALVVNVSSRSLAVQVTDGGVLLKAKSYQWVRLNKRNAANRLQVALVDSGTPEVVMRTPLRIPEKGIPVIVFLNEDPQKGQGVITYFMDCIDTSWTEKEPRKTLAQ